MTTKEKTNSSRKTAVTVGVLYIVATIAGVLAVTPMKSLLDGPDMLARIAAHESQMIMVVFLEFIMAVAVAGVAFMIYPILKEDTDTKIREGLAVWYLGSRISEGVLFLVGILATLSLLPLSREFVRTGAADASYFQTGGAVLVAVSNYAWMLGQSVFCIGALMLYYLLYQSRRVPRWLSVWGLVGAPLMLAAGFLVLVDGDPNSPLSTILYAPLALQEMAFAVWLIVKGFTPSAVAFPSAK